MDAKLKGNTHMEKRIERAVEAMDGEQWRRQDTADARAQHGHTMFVGISAQNKETWGVWGDAPQEKFGIFELPRSVLGYFRPYRRVESGALPLCGICTRCEVTSLLTANSHAVRLGERTRLRYNN